MEAGKAPPVLGPIDTVGPDKKTRRYPVRRARAHCKARRPKQELPVTNVNSGSIEELADNLSGISQLLGTQLPYHECVQAETEGASGV